MWWVVRVKRGICGCLGAEKGPWKVRGGSCIERHQDTGSRVSNCLRCFDTVLMEIEAFGSFRRDPQDDARRHDREAGQ